MVVQHAPSDDERVLIARNVRSARRHQGLSQAELAARSGLDLASVFRIEKGVRTRLGSLQKVARGLHIIYEDLLIEKVSPGRESAFAVHRAEAARWFPGSDRRKHVPEDQDDLNQLESERARLGRLGFVPWFMCPPTIIPQRGPGIVLLEIHGEMTGQFNAEFYEDGALFVLSGSPTVTVDDVGSELNPGDWIAFKTQDLQQVSASAPATALWIGANRRTHRRSGASGDS